MAYGLPRNDCCGNGSNATNSSNNCLANDIENIVLHDAAKKVIATDVRKISFRKIFHEQTLVGLLLSYCETTTNLDFFSPAGLINLTR